MADLASFRDALKSSDVDQILTDFIFTGQHEFVKSSEVDFIDEAVGSAYGISSDKISTIIVGSAHLGFALNPKKKDGITLPRYRSFSAMSDIDVAIISPRLQYMIWTEISAFYCGKTWFPPSPSKLGSYLSCGWFRPDHFPKNSSLRYCRQWFEVFNRISSDRCFRRRSVNGGLFASLEHLKMYSARAIRDCIAHEVTP